MTNDGREPRPSYPRSAPEHAGYSPSGASLASSPSAAASPSAQLGGGLRCLGRELLERLELFRRERGERFGLFRRERRALDARCDDGRERLLRVGEDRDAGRRLQVAHAADVADLHVRDVELDLLGKVARQRLDRDEARRDVEDAAELDAGRLPDEVDLDLGLDAACRPGRGGSRRGGPVCLTASICRSFTSARYSSSAVDLDRDERVGAVGVQDLEQIGARDGQRDRLDAGAVDDAGQQAFGPQLAYVAAASALAGLHAENDVLCHGLSLGRREADGHQRYQSGPTSVVLGLVVAAEDAGDRLVLEDRADRVGDDLADRHHRELREPLLGGIGSVFVTITLLIGESCEALRSRRRTGPRACRSVDLGRAVRDRGPRRPPRACRPVLIMSSTRTQTASLDLTDDVQRVDLVVHGRVAALVDDRQAGLGRASSRNCSATFTSPASGATTTMSSTDLVAQVSRISGVRRQVIERHVEEALDLSGVQVDGHHAVGARGVEAGRP